MTFLEPFGFVMCLFVDVVYRRLVPVVEYWVLECFVGFDFSGCCFDLSCYFCEEVVGFFVGFFGSLLSVALQ